VTGVDTTERTELASIIQTRHRIPEKTLRNDQTLVYQVPNPEPLRFLAPRVTESRAMHAHEEYGVMHVKLYEDIDDVQDIRLTVIAGLQQPGGEIPVRVTMQRIIWDKGGRLSEQETITDATVYEAFFAKLSKAVFLERELAWTD